MVRAGMAMLKEKVSCVKNWQREGYEQRRIGREKGTNKE